MSDTIEFKARMTKNDWRKAVCEYRHAGASKTCINDSYGNMLMISDDESDHCWVNCGRVLEIDNSYALQYLKMLKRKQNSKNWTDKADHKLRELGYYADGE